MVGKWYNRGVFAGGGAELIFGIGGRGSVCRSCPEPGDRKRANPWIGWHDRP